VRRGDGWQITLNTCSWPFCQRPRDLWPLHKPAFSGTTNYLAYGFVGDQGPLWDTSDSVTVSESSFSNTAEDADNLILGEKCVSGTVGFGLDDATGLLHRCYWSGVWKSYHLDTGADNPVGLVGTGPWVFFEFDQPYYLSMMWLWNYNYDATVDPGDGDPVYIVTDWGLKNTRIHYGVDDGLGGIVWKKLGDHEFARATGLNSYAHDDYSNSPSGTNEVDFGGVQAQYVCITAETFANGGNWGGKRWGGAPYGASEVRFYKSPEPRIKTVETDNSTLVEENGITDSFTIELAWQPDHPVTVRLGDLNGNASGLADITVDPNTITFSTSDWNSPRTIDVTAINDALGEGDEIERVYFVLDSNDPNFHHGNSIPVPVTVLDDDVPKVIITETGELTTVSEEGPTSDQYDVVLGYPPTSTVTIWLNDESSPDQVTYLPPFLSFSTSSGVAGGWDQPQTVTVTAIDDPDYEGDPHSTVITHAVTQTGGSQEYDGLEAADVVVGIADNDCNPAGHFYKADINRDCLVGLNDLALLAAEWLQCNLPNVAGCTPVP